MLISRVQSVTPTLWGCKDGASRTQWSLLQLLRRSLFSRQIWRKVTKRFQNICPLPTYLTPFQGKIVGLEEVMDASVTKLLLLSLMDQKVSVPFRQAFPNALKKTPWFKSSVRDIRAFKVENWSDFTQIVKEDWTSAIDKRDYFFTCVTVVTVVTVKN